MHNTVKFHFITQSRLYFKHKLIDQTSAEGGDRVIHETTLVMKLMGKKILSLKVETDVLLAGSLSY